jgi:uncharacterized protein with HEPN domain
MKKRDDIYIAQILERISKIKNFLKGVSRKKFLSSEIHKSAVIRELEVIGEASKQVSDETRAKYLEIPWAQMSAMRNRLIHGYFSVDESIVWEVVRDQLPGLSSALSLAFQETVPKSHPWRLCPLGQYYTEKPFKRKTKSSRKHPPGSTLVEMPCRKNPSGKDQLYVKEILLISNSHSYPSKIRRLEKPKGANDYDELIALWTKYWNDVLVPTNLLLPENVKALISSESNFNPKALAKLNKRNFARGLAQITDQTRKILGDERGELKDHFLTLTAKDILIPSVALCASIRWLFRKRETASSYLGREATWEEAIADYKSYLKNRRIPFCDQRGMKNYYETLKILIEEKK